MTALRRLELGDVEVLEQQYAGPEIAGEHGWMGFSMPGRLRKRFEDNEVLREDGGILAVVDDAGELVGELSWIRVFNGPPPQGYCWNIGIWIRPEHRGKGHGAEAQRLGAAYLFEHYYLERVEAGTEVGNVGEQRALEKAGFTREGVLRRACFRGGEWRDMVVYSKLRGEA
jgi:RimJ/RimL family protein N-acetyltransferase